MATQYPGKIDDSSSLPKVIDNVSYILADTVNRIRDSVIAVQTELGINPSGTYSSVKDRFDALEKLINELKKIIDDTDSSVIFDTLQNLQNQIDAINAEIVIINSSISTIETNISTINSDIDNIQIDIVALQSNISDIENDIGILQSDLSNLQNTVNNLIIPDPLTILVNGSEVLTNVSALDFIGGITSNTVDGYKVELTFSGGSGTTFTEYCRNSAQDTTNTNVVSITDDGLTPTVVGIGMDLHVLQFVFPSPWTGGDVIIDGYDRYGDPQSETIVYPGSSGTVVGIKTFSPGFITTAISNLVGTGLNTGFIQLRNVICVPTVPATFISVTVLGVSPGSISVIDQNSIEGWIEVNQSLSFSIYVVHYTY